MSLLSYNELLGLVGDGVIATDQKYINPASIDLTLGPRILEVVPPEPGQEIIIDLAAKEPLPMRAVEIGDDGYVLRPGHFILAHSVEVFNLSDSVATSVYLKSSIARAGLNHLMAGWADPGFNGSVLTLEFHNVTPYALRLRRGMPIVQVVVWGCNVVPADRSYRTVGRYNGDMSVQASRGVS